MAELWYTPRDVLEKGLEFVGVQWRGRSKGANKKTFVAHYGRNATVLSALWYDVCDLRRHMLDANDMDGNFRSFMKANFFLWTFPKNSEIFGAHFGENEKHCRGVFVWYWVELLADLSQSKFAWDDSYANGPHKFGWTSNGVEFSTWEPKHPLLNKDKSYFSYKHNRAGYLYLFVLEIHRPRLAMIIGPVKASEDEIGLFRKHLKGKIPPGKYVVVDKGMKSGSEETERDLLAFPNPTDSKELAKFKARVRCRQEHFHSRLRKYATLEHIWTHGIEKHKSVVQAVCLLVQYDLDLCSEMFDG